MAMLAASAACAPGVRARGSVHGVDPRCGDSEPVPLAGARVAFRCPNRPQPLLEVTTDAQGWFEVHREGLLSRDCWVQISKPGHTDQIFPVSQICAVEGTVLEGCHALAVQAELEREVADDQQAADAH